MIRQNIMKMVDEKLMEKGFETRLKSLNLISIGFIVRIML